MNKMLIVSAAVLALVVSARATAQQTSFQEWSPWKEGLQLPLDIAMVYGDDPSKIATWSAHGYIPWAMFGASWLGKNEKIVLDHPEIVQRVKDGSAFEMIKGRAWVVPIAPWIEYEKERVKAVIGGGAKGILPEEPEFFAVSGYSDGFKAAWREFYGEPWRAPHESVANQWRSNQLKAHLFSEFYRQLFSYAKSLDQSVKCLVPTHSNLNYTDWSIVAPHYDFASVSDTDGFIAQAWTGTAKHPHYVGGEPYRSSFNFSMLEYSSFAELIAGTGKEAWFLTDPVEDAEGAPWDDLRGWYEDTLIASMLFPNINTFENVPWPNRVFLSDKQYGNSPIPQNYATELLTVWMAEGMLPAEGRFIEPVTTGVGFLTSDSSMWQRGLGPDRFQGFAAPMLAAVRSGVYPRVLHAEKFTGKNFPSSDIKVIVASFDAWKPRSEETVAGIAEWVKNGGVLLYIGGSDQYDDMDFAWWRQKGFDTPADALLKALGIDYERKKIFESKSKSNEPMFYATAQVRKIAPADGGPESIKSLGEGSAPLPLTIYDVPGSKVLLTTGDKPLVWEVKCGKGVVVYAGFPGEFVSLRKQGVDMFMALLKHAAGDFAGVAVEQPGAFALDRGPFIVARGVRGDTTLKGPFINLLRPDEPITAEYKLAEGSNAFLMNIPRAVSATMKTLPIHILISSGRIADIAFKDGVLTFKMVGPAGRTGYVWAKNMSDGAKSLAAAPEFAPVTDAQTGVMRITVPLSPEGTKAEILMK